MRLKPRFKIALKLALSGFLLFGISQTSFAAYTLAVFKHGNAEGKISTANADIDCGQLNGTAFNSCTKAYTKDTNVTLTVTVPTGSRFDGWSGACIKAGLDDKCVVSMSKTQSVTAVFNTPDQPISVIPMVQGLTLFRDAIKFKVDTDLGTIATAFAITYDIREAIGWSDWFNVLYNLITTTITELNTFLVDIPTEGVKKTTFMNLMQTAGKGANTSTEFAYGILGLDNLRSAHQGLAVALFPAYSDSIKTMLNTAEIYACNGTGGTLPCINFQSLLYQEAIKNEVGLGTGLVSVLHRRSDITREKSERPIGVEDSKWKMINTVNGLIRSLKTQDSLPATFPAASMWTMLRNARQQLYYSANKPVTVNYTSSLYNPSTEKYIAHKEDVMLGRIAGLFDTQGMALKSFERGAGMQVSTTVVAAVDSVTKLTRLYLARNFKDDKGSVKYLKYGGGELSNLLSLTDVVSSSSYLWGENEYVSSRELLDSIPQEMVLQLGSELSDVWRVTDDMVGKITRSWVKLDSTWIYNPSTNHYYKVLDCGTWEQCETQARTLGGHLVTINDQAEQNWITATFASIGRLWIGYTDKETEGVFKWISGENSTYTNWATGEPNQYGSYGNEDYAHLVEYNGLWNDLGNDYPFDIRGGIIELNP